MHKGRIGETRSDLGEGSATPLCVLCCMGPCVRSSTLSRLAAGVSQGASGVTACCSFLAGKLTFGRTCEPWVTVPAALSGLISQGVSCPFFAADLCYRVQWQSGPEGTNDYLIRSCTEDLLVLSDPDANNGQGTRTSEASKTYCQQPNSNIAATHRSIVLDPSRLNTDPANIKATKSAKFGVQHLRVKSSWIVSI